MALCEVLHIGQLEVYLSQPDEEALTGSLKLFSLACEMLNEEKRVGEVCLRTQVNKSAQ